jgi:hypothetical protein
LIAPALLDLPSSGYFDHMIACRGARNAYTDVTVQEASIWFQTTER